MDWIVPQGKSGLLAGNFSEEKVIGELERRGAVKMEIYNGALGDNFTQEVKSKSVTFHLELRSIYLLPKLDSLVFNSTTTWKTFWITERW